VTVDSHPRASRPTKPQGYGVPETDEGLLDWGWAVERLEPALNYWTCAPRKEMPANRGFLACGDNGFGRR
jgi:hypothetical protein